jgi:hypothetical protein
VREDDGEEDATHSPSDDEESITGEVTKPQSRPSHAQHSGFTVELEAYRDIGQRHPSKFLQAMHSRIHRLIDEKVSWPADMNLVGKNGPRVPTPPKYGGAEDTEEFERWLSSLL